MDSIFIYTAGREGLAFEDLIEILRQFHIEIVVDIRKDSEQDPEPAFRMNWLRPGIQSAGFSYHWAAMQLGGVRPVLGNSPHRALRDEDLRGFADFMDTDHFQRGLNKLIHLAVSPLLLLGDSKLPELCHRSLISDYLVLKGVTVNHIVDFKKMEHSINPLARIENQYLRYDVI